MRLFIRGVVAGETAFKSMYKSKRVALPDGLMVWAHSAFEAKLIYREIIDEKNLR